MLLECYTIIFDIVQFIMYLLFLLSIVNIQPQNDGPSDKHSRALA